MSIQEVIVDIVALAGGRFVGRTRMQKTIYLLDAMGMGSGADFFYYNFGPFSDDIADGITDAKFTGELEEAIEHRMSDGSPFSIFTTTKTANDVTHIGKLSRQKVLGLLQRLSAASATVLELAATIHWLECIEKVDDWRSELVRRKGVKVAGGRMEKATQLLSAELDIAV